MYKLLKQVFIIPVLLGLLACQQGTATGDGAEHAVVRVVTSGGFAAAYELLGSDIEESLGIRLDTSYGSSSGGSETSIPSRLQRGEQFDLIILSRNSLDNLTQQGYVDQGSRTDLVRSRIGMAVPVNTPVPDISTVESFVTALRSADSIAYSASASGTYLSTVLWPKMGIWQELEGKSQRILTERVGTVVARGDAEIGFQQVSEILPIEGVVFVGPIPDEIQQITTFSAGILVDASNAEDAKRLLEYLASAKVADRISTTGLDPVVLESSE